MKKIKTSPRSFLAVLGLMTSACATARAPVTGLWYTNTSDGIAATSSPSGTKSGEACAISILGLIALGDSSIDAARKDGRIVEITSVDSTSLSILGVYARYCVIVRGK